MSLAKKHFSAIMPRARAGAAGRMASKRPKLSRARLANRRVKKKTKTSRVNATTVLAQGVGSVPTRPFGSVRAKPSLLCWDAKLPHHLALPRAVGPYTTVRTTRRIQSNSACMIFGAFKLPEQLTVEAAVNHNAGEWTNTCAMGSIRENESINDPNTANARLWASPLTFMGAGTSAATCVPSAVTVQILNPQPLQTTTGIIYAGVMSTQALLAGRTSTWSEWFDTFVNYMSPRLMSAAKLSLRGVQMSSYPLNMTPLSEFTELGSRIDGDYTYFQDKIEEPTGWAPMLVSNPQKVQLEYLVTTEWRVRFDLLNPASAGHVHHPIHHDGEWDRLMKQANSLGHGVQDIAEVVANMGQAAETAVRIASFIK